MSPNTTHVNGNFYQDTEIYTGNYRNRLLCIPRGLMFPACEGKSLPTTRGYYTKMWLRLHYNLFFNYNGCDNQRKPRRGDKDQKFNMKIMFYSLLILEGTFPRCVSELGY